MAIRPYLAMTTEEIAVPDKIPENAAWMLCPFSDEIANVPWKVREHPFLVLTDAVCPESAVTGNLISKICALEPKQVLLDFQRDKNGSMAAFAESLRKSLPCPVAVPGQYAHGENTPVFLPPVPLHSRLSEYIFPWQGREIWLDISREGELITLTEKGAIFEPLSKPEPDGIIHPEKQLHCHYTISLQEDSAVFTLWRTEEDMEDLLNEAQALGIPNAIGLYQEWRRSSRMPFRGES